MKFDIPHSPICPELTQDELSSRETAPVLDAYVRNMDEISKKIDALGTPDASSADMESVTHQTSLLGTLEHQPQSAIEALRQEAADNIALHIALEDHLMEQMENTQVKLRQNIGMYMDMIQQLNALQDDEVEMEGMIQ